MPPSREQLPTGQQERIRRYTLPRWMLVLLVAGAVATAALFWIFSGQGPLATVISVLFASLGLILSVMQIVPAETARRSSPAPPAPSATPVQSPVDTSLPRQSLQVSTTPSIEAKEDKKYVHGQYEDWGEAPVHVFLYGRERELTELTQWITVDHCRLIMIRGIGGIGKTSLAVALARQVGNHFTAVFWRSLQNTPRLSDILLESIRIFSDQQVLHLPDNVDGQIDILLRCLRERHCLMILDNVESILQEGERVGHYREGYADYGKLFERTGALAHQSCLLLTGREKPVEVSRQEGHASFTRSLTLTGMDVAAGKQLLADQGLQGTDKEWESLIQVYAGNPLALQLVAEPVRELFAGNIAAFLREGAALTGGIAGLLAQQFDRLSLQEQEVLCWLAIEREAIPASELQTDLVHPIAKGILLDILHSLRRRSLLDTYEHGKLYVQPVIMEYVTNYIIEQVVLEIAGSPEGPLSLFERHALIKAQAKEYIRDSQTRFILECVAKQLLSTYGKIGSEKKLYALLATLREAALAGKTCGYAAGNILNLLLCLQSNLQGANFSMLTVRQAYLRGAALPAINFAYADLTDSVCTETFGNILGVALNPEGEMLAAGTTAGEIHLWHMSDGTPLLTLKGHRDWVRSVAFSPDGSFLVSGSDDQTVRVWNSSTGKCIKTLQGHRGRVYAVAFSHDGSLLVSGGDDMLIHLWNAGNGESVGVFSGHEKRIRALAFHPTGAVLASSSADATVRLWDAHSGTCLKILRGHTGSVYTLGWNGDGTLLASGGSDRTVRLWSTGNLEGANGQCLRILEGHQGRIYTVAFHETQNVLVSGSDDQTIRLWDADTGKCTRIVYGHSNRVRSIAWSALKHVLISGGDDQTIRLWDMDSWQCLNILQGHSSWIYSVAFSPDSTLLTHDCEDHSVRLWSLQAQRYLHILRGHNSWIYSVTFSPDGTLLASGSDDQTVRLWNVESGQCMSVFQGHEGRVRCIAFHPEGTLLASGSDDQSIQLWDVHTGQCLKTLRGQGDRVRTLAFTADGEMLVSGGENQTISLWNVQKGACLHSLQGHNGRVWAVACNSLNTLLASGGDDAIVRIWKLPTGQMSQALTGHTGCIYALAFTPDGKTLVSGSEDATVRLWDSETGQLLRTLRGHTLRIRAVAVSSDGTLLASGSHDGTMKIWNIQTGACIQTVSSEKPYEQMNITGVRGITPAGKAMLKALGAIEISDY